MIPFTGPSRAAVIRHDPGVRSSIWSATACHALGRLLHEPIGEARSPSESGMRDSETGLPV